MLLNLRSLVEAARGEEHVGTGTATGAPATASGVGVVFNPVPTLPTFTSRPARRERPEPQRIVAYGIAISAMATAHAVGEVRPPAVDNRVALALLGIGGDALPALALIDDELWEWDGWRPKPSR